MCLPNNVILNSWLHGKPADLDLHLFQNKAKNLNAHCVLVLIGLIMFASMFKVFWSALEYKQTTFSGQEILVE